MSEFYKVILSKRGAVIDLLMASPNHPWLAFCIWLLLMISPVIVYFIIYDKVKQTRVEKIMHCIVGGLYAWVLFSVFIFLGGFIFSLIFKSDVAIENATYITYAIVYCVSSFFINKSLFPANIRRNIIAIIIVLIILILFYLIF